MQVRLARFRFLENGQEGNFSVVPVLDGFPANSSPGELESPSSLVVVLIISWVDSQRDKGIWEAAIRFGS